MCYLIAKKVDTPGCIAVEAQRGKHLSELVTSLGKELLERDVQVLTVSSMEAYGEYKPYNVLRTEQEFVALATAM